MNGAVFELLQSPLNLPISGIWEYFILLALNLVVYRIAFDISPGGDFGSLIHWIVRILLFLLLWSVLWLLITVVSWIIVNWVVVLVISICILLCLCGTYYWINKKDEKKE